MSTKTSIKRIAAVAAVALTLGGFSAVSANAAFTAGNIDVSLDSVNSYSSTQTTGTGIAGANNFVQITQTSNSAVAYHIVATGGTLVSSSTYVTGSGTSSVVVTAGQTVVLNVPTPTAGTITVKNYAITGGVEASSATATLTITVLAAASGTVYNHSTTYLNTTTNAAATADSTTLSAVATYNSSARARLTLTQYASTDTATAMTTAASKAVVATISGAGSIDTVSSNGATRSTTATIAAGGSTNGVSEFFVYSNGVSGTATITVTVDGVATATKTFTFSGTTVSSYKAQSDSTAGNVLKSIVAVGGSSTQDVLGYDSNGNAVAAGAGTIYAVSANTDVATVSVSSQTITVTGVKSGTTSITVCDTAACASATKTLSIPVTVAKTAIASVALSFDKDTYLPGEKMVLTVTAKDADGNLVADQTTPTVFTTDPSANVSITGFPTFTSHQVASLVAGVKTYTMYAPLASGDVVVSGTDATTAANAISAKATVTNPAAESAQAAIDAAQEATDAANAAYDAANNAMDSADAATAAAQDASDNASQALAAVTALSATVAKLVASVNSIAVALAKIQKKLKA